MDEARGSAHGFVPCCASTRVAPGYYCPLLFAHAGNHHSSNQGTLIDLAELDAPSSSSPVLAPVPDPPSGIPILPPPPQPSGPGRSRSSSQAEAPPGPNTTSNALCLLDEELLCLGASGREAAKGSSGRAGRGQCGIGWSQGCPVCLAGMGKETSVVGQVKFRVAGQQGRLYVDFGVETVDPVSCSAPLPTGGCLYLLPTD